MHLDPGHAFFAALIGLAVMPTVQAADNLGTVKPTEVMSGVRDYGFLWWADGWRGRSENGGKVICVRTGNHGLALDVERLRLVHFGAISEASPADRAVAEDIATIMNLPAADLDIAVELGSEQYRLVGALPQVQDDLDFPVRLIESGRWHQRFDIQHLIFENDKKERLDADARLEIAAWPDFVSFSIELKPVGNLANREIRLSCRLVAEGTTSSTTPRVSRIRPGETIKETLVKSFGTPARTAKIDDLRPLLVWGMNQSKAKWSWTNNVGGGDFLVYVDRNGKRQYDRFRPHLQDLVTDLQRAGRHPG